MSEAFYPTLAQVLPMLLLALLWESGYLRSIGAEPRVPRSLDPHNGVRFWTKPRVRVHVLAVATLLVVDIGITIAVLAGILPDWGATRVLVLLGAVLALATLLTRVWVDVLAATKVGAESEGRP